MKLNRLSVKRLCLLIGAGALLSMLAITITFYALTGNELFFLMGAALMICALFWLIPAGAVLWKAAVPLYFRIMPDIGQHDQRQRRTAKGQ